MRIKINKLIDDKYGTNVNKRKGDKYRSNVTYYLKNEIICKLKGNNIFYCFQIYKEYQKYKLKGIQLCTLNISIKNIVQRKNMFL